MNNTTQHETPPCPEVTIPGEGGMNVSQIAKIRAVARKLWELAGERMDLTDENRIHVSHEFGHFPEIVVVISDPLANANIATFCCDHMTWAGNFVSPMASFWDSIHERVVYESAETQEIIDAAAEA